MLSFLALSFLLLGCASAAPVKRDLLGLSHKVTDVPTRLGCYQNGRRGHLLDGLCILSDVTLVTRDDSVGDGKPCKLVNGAPGVWQYGLCVRAGTTIHRKDLLHFNQGQPCEGAYGSGYWNKGLCVPILDGVVDIEPQNGLLRREPLFDGIPCWHEGKFGYLKNKHCILDGTVDITLKKRLDTNLLNGNNLLGTGDLVGGLSGNRKYKSGYYDDDDVVSQLTKSAGLGDLLVRSDEVSEEKRALPLLGNGLGAVGGPTGGKSPLGAGLPGGIGL